MNDDSDRPILSAAALSDDGRRDGATTADASASGRSPGAASLTPSPRVATSDSASAALSAGELIAEAPPSPPRNTFSALKRFAQPRPAAPERCELCAAPLAEEHEHLLELATRQLQCACGPCAILFSNAQGGKLRRVPRRLERWTDFAISDEQWEALGVPIALAFFFFSTPAQQLITLYPSPGGATESSLPRDVWDMLCEDNARLGTLEADVEALLVNRIRGAREYYRAPIDQCFGLVGLIRAHWRGLSGGTEVWKRIEGFFAQLKGRAAQVSAHA
jgi:hypothetical protein